MNNKIRKIEVKINTPKKGGKMKKILISFLAKIIIKILGDCECGKRCYELTGWGEIFCLFCEKEII